MIQAEDGGLLLNQREMAEALDVSTNTLAKWKLPRARADSAKGTEVFYDVGACLYIVAGRELATKLEAPRKPSDLEAMALGYIFAPGVDNLTEADTKRFQTLARRAGFDSDSALIALAMAAQRTGLKIRQISAPNAKKRLYTRGRRV